MAISIQHCQRLVILFLGAPYPSGVAVNRIFSGNSGLCNISHSHHRRVKICGHDTRDDIACSHDTNWTQCSSGFISDEKFCRT